MMTALDLRGRDLIITPPEEDLHLPTPELLTHLFGSHLPAPVRSSIGRDKRHHFLRTKPMYFSAIKAALSQQQTPFTVAFEERPALPYALALGMEPRPYQEEALTNWLAEGSRGVVVLPTGAGKTLVAAMAIAETGLWTLVVVPTIDLLQQWRAALTSAFQVPTRETRGAGGEAPAGGAGVSPEKNSFSGIGEEIGIFGGGEKDLKPITIITYDSAALYPRELRRFGLLIFDECHHLPAPTYRRIAESAFTPLRLGLSATPERSDMAHADLEELIGPEVYRRSPSELTERRYLAQYEERRVAIALSPEDEMRYNEQRRIYRSFLQRRRISIRSPEEFQQKLIYLTARDPEARAAMLAWRETRSI